MRTILRLLFEPRKAPDETNLGRIWSVRLTGSEPYAWAGSESYVVVVHLGWFRETHIAVAHLGRLQQAHYVVAHQTGVSDAPGVWG